MYSKTMWNKQRYCWQLQNHVRIANFSGESREITIPSKSSYFIMVFMIWLVMQQNVWDDRCELANKTTQQLYKVSTPCIDDHHFKEEGVTSMLSNCSEMLIFGTYWKTWYSMVSEQIYTIDYEMDQSLWQTIISFDIIYSSYMWIQTLLSCG